MNDREHHEFFECVQEVSVLYTDNSSDVYYTELNESVASGNGLLTFGGRLLDYSMDFTKQLGPHCRVTIPVSSVKRVVVTKENKFSHNFEMHLDHNTGRFIIKEKH